MNAPGARGRPRNALLFAASAVALLAVVLLARSRTPTERAVHGRPLSLPPRSPGLLHSPAPRRIAAAAPSHARAQASASRRPASGSGLNA